MIAPYLFIFLTLNLWATGEAPKIQVLPGPQYTTDFEHQFKGCPENSACDQVMGLQMENWQKLITKLKDENITPEKKGQFLELFRAKHGIPTEFYTYKKSEQGFKPIYFNSQCSIHNPKKNELKVLKGTAFVKSINNERAIIWRDQTQIEVPIGEIFIPQPVKVYGPSSATYQLPIEDQPLFIKNNELYILKEDEDLFYILKISPNGDWQITSLDFTRLSEWEEKRQNTKCPDDPTYKIPNIFGVSFCKTIWNEDLKKTVIIRMHQGCSI